MMATPIKNQRRFFSQNVLGCSAAAAGAKGTGPLPADGAKGTGPPADGANGTGPVFADGAKGTGLFGSAMFVSPRHVFHRRYSNFLPSGTPQETFRIKTEL